MFVKYQLSEIKNVPISTKHIGIQIHTHNTHSTLHTHARTRTHHMHTQRHTLLILKGDSHTLNMVTIGINNDS